MRTGDRANAVKRILDIGHPVAQRFVHSVFEGFCPRLHRHYLGAEHVHAKHIRLLPLDVDGAHVNDAFETKTRAEGCRRHAVHSSAGLCDNAFLSHALREQNLPEHIVDLVRTGVIELFALEINLGAAARKAGGRLPAICGQPLGEIEGRRPPDIVREIAVHLLLKLRVGFGSEVSLLQLQNQRHQRFSDKAAAVKPEMPVIVRPGAKRIGSGDIHAGLAAGFATRRFSPSRAARTKARILPISFCPAARSTPEDTSTPGAEVMRNASATFAAFSPPESMKGTPGCRSCRRRQSKGLPSPPGRVASCGARASNNRRSTSGAYMAAPATSALSSTAMAFITGKPKRFLSTAIRSGCSLP